MNALGVEQERLSRMSITGQTKIIQGDGSLKFLAVGDIHEQIEVLKEIKEKFPYMKIIQVGDYGIGFQSPEWDDAADKFNLSNDIRFIRGNHDSPDQCKRMKSWIPDGYIEDGIMFVGGAWSIDQGNRILGVSWWPDEELSDREFDVIVEKYLDEKPDIMITHDCPYDVAFTFFSRIRYIQRTRTSGWFEYMFEMHQPKAWFFGHWHEKHDKTILKNGNETRFICLDINETLIIDTENLK